MALSAKGYAGLKTFPLKFFSLRLSILFLYCYPEFRCRSHTVICIHFFSAYPIQRSGLFFILAFLFTSTAKTSESLITTAYSLLPVYLPYLFLKSTLHRTRYPYVGSSYLFSLAHPFLTSDEQLSINESGSTNTCSKYLFVFSLASKLDTFEPKFAFLSFSLETVQAERQKHTMNVKIIDILLILDPPITGLRRGGKFYFVHFILITTPLDIYR